MNSFLKTWLKCRDYLSYESLGGPKILKASWVINLQKVGSLPFVLLLMWTYDCYTPTAWIYAALHGSYGLCWLLKDSAFPDPNWEKKVTFCGALLMWLLVLGPYWIAPIIITTQKVEAPLWLLFAATFMYVLGVVIMMCSDAQKYFTLKIKRGLIMDGFFAYVRHPNYLGEIIIYASFALLAKHWLPWAVLGWVWLGLFLPNILSKEASMARYPEWMQYKARTGFLLPRIFKKTITS